MSAVTRVTFLINSFGPGGAQRQIVEVCEQMPPEVQTSVAWYDRTGEFPQLPENIETLILPRRNRYDPRFATALGRLCSKSRTDVIHAWLGASSLYAGLVRQVPTKVPVITAVGCSRTFFDTNPLEGRAHAVAALLADHTTVNCHDVIDWLCERGVPRDKITFIANIVPHWAMERTPSTPDQQRALLEELGLPTDVAPIVHLARFDAFKNHDGLVRALIALRKAGVEVPPVVMAGRHFEPERAEHVRQLAAREGFDDLLHLIAPVREVATLMEAARLVVLPSHSEGLPNVVLEALALGRPLVATRVGEVPTMVEHGVNGVLCDPGDDDDLARALKEALEMPASAVAEMGRTAQNRCLATYSGEVILAQQRALYERVIEQPRTAWMSRIQRAMGLQR